jgi:hypothetical protein
MSEFRLSYPFAWLAIALGLNHVHVAGEMGKIHDGQELAFRELLEKHQEVRFKGVRRRFRRCFSCPAVATPGFATMLL